MNDSNSNLPPAGWMEDPQDSNRQRWWDGAGWTDYYRATTATQTPTAAQDPATPLGVVAAHPTTSSAPQVPGTIAIDWRPTVWSLSWSWLLMFIPTIVAAVTASTTSYTLHDGTFIARNGLVTKQIVNVDLYRVKTVNAVESAFGGNSISIVNSDGTVQTFGLIRYASAIAQQIRALSSTARDEKNTTYREVL